MDWQSTVWKDDLVIGCTKGIALSSSYPLIANELNEVREVIIEEILKVQLLTDSYLRNTKLKASGPTDILKCL